MTVRGTLRADGLVVAKITVDFLMNPVKVHAVAALMNTEGGQTLGWTEGDGSAWSPETMRQLQMLRDAMEEDLASRLFSERQDTPGGGGRAGLQVGGLGELVGEGNEPPSI